MYRLALATALLLTTGFVARSSQDEQNTPDPPVDEASAEIVASSRSNQEDESQVLLDTPVSLGLGLDPVLALPDGAAPRPDADAVAQVSADAAPTSAEENDGQVDDDVIDEHEDHESDDELADDNDEEEEADEQLEDELAAVEEDAARLEVEFDVEEIQLEGHPDVDVNWRGEHVEHEVGMFALKHGRAAAVAQLIQRMFPDADMIVEADERTNQLLVRCSPVVRERIAQLIKQLDLPPPMADPFESTSQSSPDSATNQILRRVFIAPSQASTGIRADVLPPNGVQAADSFIWFPSSEDPRQHFQQMGLLAQQGQAEMLILTDQIRQLRQATEPDEKALADLERQLRERVRDAFDARQQVQRAELAILQQQLTSIDETIAQRDRDKEHLIEQRVERLLRSDQPDVTSPPMLPDRTQFPGGLPTPQFPPTSRPPAGRSFSSPWSMTIAPGHPPHSPQPPSPPPAPPSGADVRPALPLAPTPSELDLQGKWEQQAQQFVRQQESLLAQIAAMEEALARLDAHAKTIDNSPRSDALRSKLKSAHKRLQGLHEEQAKNKASEDANRDAGRKEVDQLRQELERAQKQLQEAIQNLNRGRN